MTPKEKAKKLCVKIERVIYGHAIGGISEEAKGCALIVVEEIIKSRKEDRGFDDHRYSLSEYHTPHPMYLTYWEQVKTEIEKI